MLFLGPVHRERWSYACAKQLLERLIWAHGHHGRLSFTIVRPFNVIGTRMDYLPGIDGEGIPRVFASFMAALLRQEELLLVDGGEQKRALLRPPTRGSNMPHRRAKPTRVAVRSSTSAIHITTWSIRELAEQMVRAYSCAGPQRERAAPPSGIRRGVLWPRVR